MEKSKDDMDTALRRGLETIERLRQYRALTVESEIKAARPETANRGFREQSTWWLTKQDLPKTWFSSKGNSPQIQTQSQSSPSSGPNLSSNRSHSVAALRFCGDTDDEILSATSDPDCSEDAAKATNGSGLGPVTGSGASPRARAAAAASRAACASMHIENVDRGGGGGCGSLSFRSVAAAAMGAEATAAAGGSGGGSGARSNIAFERVAWALKKTRRSNSTSGAVMYDGGGDEAVPNEAAVVPIQPPKGYARYTVNLFEQHRRRHSGANVSEGPNELLVSESEGDEEEEEMGKDEAKASDDDGSDVSGGAALAGLKLGTGFRALADEDVASNMQQLAVASAIAAAAARVAASNAQARGFIPGGARPYVGLIGGISAGSADDDPPSPTFETGTLPQHRQQQKGPAPDPFVSPPRPTLATNTGREASSRNAAANHNRAISPAPPVRASRASCVALISSSRAGEMSSLADSHAAAGADPPPPVQQQPDGRPATAMRRRRNTVFVLRDSSSPWETPPGSPTVANRAPTLEHHGRLRLGSSAMRSPSVTDAAAAVTVEFAAASGPAASGLPAAAAGGSGDPAAAVAAVAAASGLRARMRAKSVCASAGTAGEDNRRASVACTGTFSRCLLAPMSPSPSSQTVQNATMSNAMSVGHIGIVSPKVSRRNLLQLSSRKEDGEADVDASCGSDTLVSEVTQSPTGGHERILAGDSGDGAAQVKRYSTDRHENEAELEGGDMPPSGTASTSASTSSPPRVSQFLATAAAGSAAAAAAAAAALARPRSASCSVSTTSPTAAALLLRCHRGPMQASGMESGPGSALASGTAVAASEPTTATAALNLNSPPTQDITGAVSPTATSAANVMSPATAAAAAIPALIDSPRAPTAIAVTPTAGSGRMYRSFTFAADDDVHGVRVRFSHMRNMQNWEGCLARHGSRVRSASSTGSGAISMGGADGTGSALKPTTPRRLSNRRSLSYCGAVSSVGGGGLVVCGVGMGSSTGGVAAPRRGSTNGIGLLDDSRPVLPFKPLLS
ncbi:hypothetical protein Vafri_298 [Volvox africanus]|nr:hypothetical protein Vafri_298 [Volvox africanus]